MEILEEGEGYATVGAGDGQEALWGFDREALDFVGLDIMMPGINGDEMCRKFGQMHQPFQGDQFLFNKFNHLKSLQKIFHRIKQIKSMT